MKEVIVTAGIGAVLILFLLYLWYCFCLALVFKKLQVAWWPAFVPGYNFMTLMGSVGLPRKWFFFALVPYVGFVYSLATAERLGKAFNKSFAYSATWLTIGAAVGMAQLGLSKKEQPDLSIRDLPVPSIRQLKKLRLRKEQLDAQSKKKDK